MTSLLIDLASYQDGIDLAAVKAAGFTKVNVKLSQGNWYQWANAGTYIQRARDLGMGISTFHWLDNSASGAEQARVVLGLMRRYGVLAGTAHQCDCEDSQRPASWTIWRDYMNAMQDGLQRHAISYTGDWWWPGHMGSRGAEVTPYLWAAPNHGYDSAYPGDQSPDWYAGYGGWGDYSILQYAVQPIPGAGGGDLSKSAIRDPQVWAALTGTGGAMTIGLEAVVTTIDGKQHTLQELVTYLASELLMGGSYDLNGPGSSASGLLRQLATQVGTMQSATAAPSQEMHNAAVLNAMLDPRVQAGIGAAVASHLKVV